jgi:hypothetical protein
MQAEVLGRANRLTDEQPRLGQAVERGEETRQECETLNVRELSRRSGDVV